MTWICSQCGEKFSRFRTRCSTDGQRVIEDYAGQLIGGRYRVRELAGIGGMDSTVWKAWQTGTERVVAVKILPATDEASSRRFARGARIAANLNHPNCTVVHDYGTTEDGKLFLVMEYLNGQVLAEILGPEGMSVADSVHVADQVLQALEHAHSQRAVHRDLKPDNLFLSRKNDDPLHVKILDFGIAKYVEEDPDNATSASTEEKALSDGFEDLVTEQKQVCGTPQYMAPEQVVGGRIDGRTDLYALGCVLYRMLTGRLPFDGKTRYELYQKHLQEAPKPFRDVRPDLVYPDRLELIVMKALSKRPDQRFQNAAEMRKALATVQPQDDRQPRGVRPRVSLKHTAPQGPMEPTVLPAGHWTLSIQAPPPPSEPPLPPEAPAFDLPEAPAAEGSPSGLRSAAPPPLPSAIARFNRPSVPDAEVPPTLLPEISPILAPMALQAAPGGTVLDSESPGFGVAPRMPSSTHIAAANSDRPRSSGSLLSDSVVRHPAGRSSLTGAPEVPRSTETEPNRAREAGDNRRRRLGIAAVLGGAFLLGVGGVALTMQLVKGDDAHEDVAPLAVTEDPPAEPAEGAKTSKPVDETPRSAGLGARDPRDPNVLANAQKQPEVVSAEPAAEMLTRAGTTAGHALAEVPIGPAPTKVLLKIDTEPSEAQVSEGATVLGPTPLEAALPPGRHVLTIERDGYVKAILELELTESQLGGAAVTRKLVLAVEKPEQAPLAPIKITRPHVPLTPNEKPEPEEVEGPEPEKVVAPQKPQAPQVKLLDDRPGDGSKKPTIKLLEDEDAPAPKKPEVKTLE